MKRIFLLSLLISLLLATNLFADCTTTVSGIIDGETWTKAGSPYCVDGNIIVRDLTITEGVRIEFSGAYEFKVERIEDEDKLDATGTAQDPIIFTSAAGAPGWKGIILEKNCDSKLIHCQIEKSSNRGLTILNCVPTVQNCSITNNTVNGEGGGLYVMLDTSADELHLKNCRINDNDSTSHGGGIYALLSSGSLVLEDCEINSNRDNYLGSNGNYYGGGLYVASAAGGLCLINCEISDNYSYSRCSGTNCRSSGAGGGIYIYSGNVSCIRSVITSNTARAYCSGSGCRGYAYGGGIYQAYGALKLTNCIISHNAPSAGNEYGGGIFTGNATVGIENCTIAYNQNEGIYNSSGIVEVINSIVYSNAGTQIAGNATVTYSDVEGGYDGEGNIGEDPLFESILNLRIRCDYSPCVDAGSERPWYNDMCFPPSCKTERNDMGAHGGPEAAKPCICPDVCLGDFDNDGDVDGSDLAIFAGDFGRTDCPVILNIFKWKCL